MEILFVAILSGVIASMIFSAKGRSGLSGFFLGLFLSVIGVLIAAFLPADQASQEANQLATGEVKKCRACLSIIPIEASACRFCGRDA